MKASEVIEKLKEYIYDLGDREVVIELGDSTAPAKQVDFFLAASDADERIVITNKQR
jgi:hypothetical protein